MVRGDRQSGLGEEIPLWKDVRLPWEVAAWLIPESGGLDRAKEGEIGFGMGFLVSDGEDWVMIKFGEGTRPRVVQEWTNFSSVVGRSSWIGRSALSCVLCDGTR